MNKREKEVKMASKGNMLGSVAYIVGIVIAVLVGLFGASFGGNAGLILVIVGLIVGLLNVNDKEVTPFLIAAIALLVAGSAGELALSGIPLVGGALSGILGALIVVFVPATVIVALKEVVSLAKA